MRGSTCNLAKKIRMEPMMMVVPENAIIPVYDPSIRSRSTPAVGPPRRDLKKKKTIGTDAMQNYHRGLGHTHGREMML
jgi:hypothetical protein